MQKSPSSRSSFLNKPIFIVLGVVIAISVVSIGTYSYNQYTTKNQNEAMMKKDDSESAMMKKDTNTNDAMKATDDKMTPTDVMTKDQKTTGEFIPYSTDLLKKADSGNVIIFFNASWCPDCQATVKDIKANEGNIPQNLTILSADYDKETSLRQKYGITMQHTFVKVDANGNLIKKASGLGTLQKISNFASQS